MLAGEKPADLAASPMETTLFSQANGSRGGIAFGVFDHSASSGAELISTGPTRATNRPSRLDLQRGIGPFQSPASLGPRVRSKCFQLSGSFAHVLTFRR